MKTLLRPFLLNYVAPIDLKVYEECMDYSLKLCNSYNPHTQMSANNENGILFTAGTSKTYDPTYSGTVWHNKDDSEVTDH